ncbi:MAG: metallophosphoesterase [Clostridia bacterium]|nr:metallophosphoesterase [Clostridia bacterium]
MKILFSVVLIAVILILVLLFYNAASQFLFTLHHFFPTLKPRLFYGIYAALTLATATLFFLGMGTLLSRPLVVIGRYLTGFFLYFMMVENLFSLLLFPLRKLQVDHAPLCVGAGILALCLICGLFLYGSLHPLNLKTKEYQVTLQEGARGQMRIALISDLHLGYTVGEKRLCQLRDRIREEQPDLVLIAGDIFDGAFRNLKDPQRLCSILQEIKAPLGVFACTGNHDAGEDYEEMLRFLEESEIRLLQDEAVLLENGVVLAGRRDSSPIGKTDIRRQSLSLPEGDHPVILMDHQPANLSQYGSEIDLMVSGHTHKGQMFPFGFITDALFEVDYGYYQKDSRSPQVIVTSGAGLWGPPLRIASDCEVVFIDTCF